MNKGGLVAEVPEANGLSKADVGRVVDAAIDSIRESVVQGERVTLADFGTFERKHRNERIARNPRKPDVPIVVPARDLPAFTPGKEFREQVLESVAGARRPQRALVERHEAQSAARQRCAVGFGRGRTSTR